MNIKTTRNFSQTTPADILHENANFRIILTGTTYAVQYVEDGYIAQYFTTLAEAKKYIGATQ